MQIFEVILFFKLRKIQQKTVKPTYLLSVRCQEAGGRKRARGSLVYSTIQKEQTLRRLTFKCKIRKIVLVMPLKYTGVAQSILCLTFLICVATMHRLNYSGQDSKNNLQFYDSDIPVTFK